MTDVEAVISCAVAGGALLVAFPPFGWWRTAPIGVALLAALGMLTGLTFCVPPLSFVGLQVG